MQLLKVISVVVFGLLVSAQQSPPKELEIKITHTPSDCTVKAQKGDPIQVHYVRLCSPTPVICVAKTSLPHRPESYFPMVTNSIRGTMRVPVRFSLHFAEHANIATTAANLCL